jgi:hypothetical protein
MTAQSWPELAQKVADVIRENEVLKWELVKVKDENAKLEQALERACEWILKSANRKCEGCPVRAIPEPCQLGKCKETIIWHFKEATQ